MASLDEKALRRPSFTEGYSVRLADGQEWTFPKPRIRFYPTIAEDGSVAVGGGRSFGEDHDKLIDVLIGGEEIEDFERLRLRFAAAVSLLSRNYSLKPEDFASILVIDQDDPETGPTWARIDRIVLGLTPEDDPSPKA